MASSRFPRRRGRWQPVKSRYFAFNGGLNEVDPQITMPDGMLIAAENYEVGVRGGYRRIDGYERFDGRLSPSSGSYWIVPYDTGVNEPAVGDVFGDASTLAASTIAGRVLVAAVLDSGSWGSNAAGYIVMGEVEGKSNPSNFSDNDNPFDTGAGTQGHWLVDGDVTQESADTEALHDTYLEAAIEALRDQIAVVPGSGDILGVYLYNGVVYAFRNNAGSTATDMYKSSTSGWTIVDLGGTLEFTSGGTTEEVAGNTITGDTSTKSATITRIETDSGDWGAGTAAGTIFYTGKTGAFTSGENFNTNNFTMTGAESDVSLTKDGKFRFETANFSGHASTIYMYGVDGKNKAFQFDGTNFIQITTGMTTDTPSHVVQFEYQLHLGFAGGSLQQSALGDPFNWTPVLGASEIATGDEISALLVVPGDVVVIFNRNRTYLLYGPTGSYDLKEFSTTSGAIENSVQLLGSAVYCDDRGIVTLASTDQFGDFQDATISQLVQDTMKLKKFRVVESCIVREKNQYRLFFDDNTALYVTFNDRMVSGIIPVELDHKITAITSEEDTTGNEEIYFGSTDGYVYQMDKGTSFDGQPMRSYLKPNPFHMGSPGIRKRFRKIELEAVTENEGLSTTQFVPTFSYESGDAANHRVDEIEVTQVTAQNPINIPGTSFNGRTDSLSRGSISAEILDFSSDLRLTISFWFRVDELPDSTVTIMHSGETTGDGTQIIQLNSSGTLTATFKQYEAATTIFTYTSLTAGLTFTADGEWHHVFMSIDNRAAIDGGNKRWVAIDGVGQGTTGSTQNPDKDFSLSQTSWGIAAGFSTFAAPVPRTPDQEFAAISIADFWYDTVYFPETDANLEQFIKNGDPVDLGPDGTNPTGFELSSFWNQNRTGPLFYLTKRHFADFQDGLGAAGNEWTVNGRTRPSDWVGPYHEVAGLPVPDRITTEAAIELVPVDKTHAVVEVDSQGSGQNVSLTVYSNGVYESPHTIYGAIIYYDERRRVR